MRYSGRAIGSIKEPINLITMVPIMVGMMPALDPASATPLYRQLFEQLRHDIVTGRQVSGTALIATREMAARLGISRNTVTAAYDMLLAEGYVVSRQGSGYYAASVLPEASLQPVQQDRTRSTATRRGLSSRGEVIARTSRPVSGAGASAFQRGLPALDAFPFRQWQQHLDHHCRNPRPDLLRYRDDGGLPALRTALSEYLRSARGVHCEPSQVIIVTGGQAALDLVARMLVDDGDSVAIEEPGYLGARDALQAAGAELVPVPVDDQGLCIEQCPREDVRLVYTTPSYQFPLGVIQSAARRMQLLQWADERDAYIIEDDYDSEFRYQGHPLSSMQGLDSAQRVIYMGTFSKVMFPALRLGYLVVPRHLESAFAAALRKTGQDAPLIIQAAMADFISSGQFTAHIRRMRKLYATRQTTFVRLARQALGEWLEVEPTDAGMQLACPFRQSVDERRLESEAAGRDLDIGWLSSYYLGKCDKPGLFLGYAGVPEAAMAGAIMALREALECSVIPRVPRGARSAPQGADDS